MRVVRMCKQSVGVCSVRRQPRLGGQYCQTVRTAVEKLTICGTAATAREKSIGETAIFGAFFFRLAATWHECCDDNGYFDFAQYGK